MHTNTATECRDLPLAVLSESPTNPHRIFEDAALKELAESIRSPGRSVSTAGAASYQPELRDCRRSETLPRRTNCGGLDCARPYRPPHRCRGTGGQLIELSIVGKSFLCLMRPGTSFICNRRARLTSNCWIQHGLSPPRSMACGPDSQYTGNPPADSIEFPTGNFAYCSNFRIGDNPTGTRKGASFPLGACIGLLSPTEHRTDRGRTAQVRYWMGLSSACLAKS